MFATAGDAFTVSSIPLLSLSSWFELLLLLLLLLEEEAPSVARANRSASSGPPIVRGVKRGGGDEGRAVRRM